MKAKRMRWLCVLAGLTLSIGLAGGTPLAAQDSCQAVNDAIDKATAVPTHTYTDMTPALTNGGEPGANDIHHAETIYFGTEAFTKLRGKWARSEWTGQRVLKQEQENRQTGNFSCEYLGDEHVNGERAAVYSTRSERANVRSDGQIWISKRRGLPLRREYDIEMTGGAASKDHVLTRYEYSNVRAPM